MNVEYAYIAGLVDGEGTITLTYNNKNDPFRTPIVSMSSTSRILLEYVQVRFGGSIVKHKVYQTHHKQSWSWCVQRQKSVTMLACINPFLLEPIKSLRSHFILAHYTRLTPRNGKYSEALRAEKYQFEKQFFELS